MKTLILMRHSEAQEGLSSEITRDFDRPLTDKGISMLEGVQRFLKEQILKPELVYCSPAARTKQTLHWVQEAFSTTADVHFEESLYNARADAIKSLIWELPNTAKTAMVIGHNPSISQVSHELYKQSAKEKEAEPVHPLKPSQITVFQIDTPRWDQAFMSPLTALSHYEKESS